MLPQLPYMANCSLWLSVLLAIYITFFLMSTLSLLCCNLNSTLAALSPVDIEKLISFLAEVSFMYLKSADLVLGREKNQKKIICWHSKVKFNP